MLIVSILLYWEQVIIIVTSQRCHSTCFHRRDFWQATVECYFPCQ